MLNSFSQQGLCGQILHDNFEIDVGLLAFMKMMVLQHYTLES